MSFTSCGKGSVYREHGRDAVGISDQSRCWDMIGGRKRKHADRRRATHHPQARHHTKVTYIAALSDWLALRVATGAAPSDPAPVHPTCSLSSTNFRRVRWNGPSVRALAQHSTGDITLHRPGLGDSIAQRHQYFQPQGMDHSSIAL